jgi:hypothetical protein
VTAGAGACPKCGRARPTGAEACARCGLVFARWDAGAGAAAAGELDARGEALWAELQDGARWSDEAHHHDFLKHCAAAGCLAAAGRRYRLRLDAQPGDALAARMQARVVAMASAALAPMRTPPPPANRRKLLLAMAGGAAILGAVAGLLSRRLRR